MDFKQLSVTILSWFIVANFAYANDITTIGDPEYGEYLSGECVACHQAGSTQSAGIPSITGWDPEVFSDVLMAYKNKELDNPVMQMIAGRLDREQMASLAVYFEKLPAAE